MNGTWDGFKLPGFEIYQEKWEIRFENLIKNILNYKLLFYFHYFSKNKYLIKKR